ncbi:hypothetical protein [Sulfurovum sp.]|uniref:hypothetical protein n=1 Tax=Sulfurovum sp. TaxID=1969726 RepID=UPI0025ED6E0E|nr:hypothetical protein [Sulfurovum sp.]
MLDFINDKTTNTLRTILYAPIRLHITGTGETINIGVSLTDGDEYVFKTIPSFDTIDKCVHIENTRAFDFVLKQINEKYHHPDVASRVHVSKTIYIDEAVPYMASDDLHATAEKLFEQMVTIYEPRTIKNNDRSSNAIVSHIKMIASDRFNDHIVFRKHIQEAFNKQIDTVVENDERNPIVLGEVCSPVVSSFHHDVATSIMALEMSMRMVASTLLYMPAYRGLKSSVVDTYRYAMQTAREKRIEVIDTTDADEFAGIIADVAAANGVIIETGQ